MRILIASCAAALVAAGTLSVALWRNLEAERQTSAQLRAQLDEAKAALVARPEVVPIAPVVIAAAGESAPAALPAEAAIAMTTAETATATATATRLAESAQRTKTLLADSQYRKALLEQARVSLRQRYAGLAQELGIPQRDVDAVIEILAQAQVRISEQYADLMTNGMPTDSEAQARLTRLGAQFDEQVRTELTGVLGPQGYDRLQEFDQTEGSRTRVTNLTNLLARSGQALSAEQSRQLTRVIVAEQRRMEAETKALADSGQISTRAQSERQAETNRNILAAAGNFLSTAQLDLVSARFRERASIDQAADRVQQREREVLQPAR